MDSGGSTQHVAYRRISVMETEMEEELLRLSEDEEKQSDSQSAMSN